MDAQRRLGARRGTRLSRRISRVPKPSKTVSSVSTAASRNKNYLKIVQTIPVCDVLTKRQKLQLVSLLEPLHFKDGEYIIRQNEIGDAFYIIERGAVVVTRRDNPDDMFETPTVVGKMQAHQYFGEIALLVKQRRTANCVASGSVMCLKLSRDNFEEIITPALDGERTQFSSRMNNLDTVVLKNVSVFKPLSNLERQVIAKVMLPITFSDGEYICRQGARGEAFFVILHGEVLVTLNHTIPNAASGAAAASGMPAAATQTKVITRLGELKYFGEMALLSYDSLRTANAIAVGTVHCVFLHRIHFRAIPTLGALLVTMRDSLLGSQYAHTGGNGGGGGNGNGGNGSGNGAGGSGGSGGGGGGGASAGGSSATGAGEGGVSTMVGEASGRVLLPRSRRAAPLGVSPAVLGAMVDSSVLEKRKHAQRRLGGGGGGGMQGKDGGSSGAAILAAATGGGGGGGGSGAVDDPQATNIAKLRRKAESRDGLCHQLHRRVHNSPHLLDKIPTFRTLIPFLNKERALKGCLAAVRRVLKTAPPQRSEEDLAFLQLLLMHTDFTAKLFVDPSTPGGAQNFTELCRRMRLVSTEVGTVVCSEGDPSSSAFVILSGLVSVVVKGKVLNMLGPAQSFGELALMSGMDRTADCITPCASSLILIDRSDYNEVVTRDRCEMTTEDKYALLQSTHEFAAWDPYKLYRLAGLFRSVMLSKDSVLFKQHEVSPALFIVRWGEVQLRKRSDRCKPPPLPSDCQSGGGLPAGVLFSPSHSAVYPRHSTEGSHGLIASTVDAASAHYGKSSGGGGSGGGGGGGSGGGGGDDDCGLPLFALDFRPRRHVCLPSRAQNSVRVGTRTAGSYFGISALAWHLKHTETGSGPGQLPPPPRVLLRESVTAVTHSSAQLMVLDYCHLRRLDAPTAAALLSLGEMAQARYDSMALSEQQKQQEREQAEQQRQKAAAESFSRRQPFAARLDGVIAHTDATFVSALLQRGSGRGGGGGSGGVGVGGGASALKRGVHADKGSSRDHRHALPSAAPLIQLLQSSGGRSGGGGGGGRKGGPWLPTHWTKDSLHTPSTATATAAGAAGTGAAAAARASSSLSRTRGGAGGLLGSASSPQLNSRNHVSGGGGGGGGGGAHTVAQALKRQQRPPASSGSSSCVSGGGGSLATSAAGTLAYVPAATPVKSQPRRVPAAARQRRSREQRRWRDEDPGQGKKQRGAGGSGGGKEGGSDRGASNSSSTRRRRRRRPEYVREMEKERKDVFAVQAAAAAAAAIGGPRLKKSAGLGSVCDNVFLIHRTRRNKGTARPLPTWMPPADKYSSPVLRAAAAAAAARAAAVVPTDEMGITAQFRDSQLLRSDSESSSDDGGGGSEEEAGFEAEEAVDELVRRVQKHRVTAAPITRFGQSGSGNERNSSSGGLWQLRDSPRGKQITTVASSPLLAAAGRRRAATGASMLPRSPSQRGGDGLGVTTSVEPRSLAMARTVLPLQHPSRRSVLK